MARSNSLPGDLIQFDEPEWTPLINVLGNDLAGWFMWMCEIGLADERRVHAYKHVTTHRYLHVDVGGRAFGFQADGRYREIALPTGIARAFVGWERAGPQERDIAALRAVIQRVRFAA